MVRAFLLVCIAASVLVGCSLEEESNPDARAYAGTVPRVTLETALTTTR
ncbi:hypothetical protein [Kribbella sp. NPDC023855]